MTDKPLTPRTDRRPRCPDNGKMQIGASPETDPTEAARVHTVGIAATVHANGLAHRLGDRLVGLDYAQSSITYTSAVFDRTAPRDPLEEMLVAQLVATHTRAMNLADLAMAQRDIDAIRVINEYADRASNTYRRLMLAMAEYRKPPKGGDTHIRQANIAAQQVVLNADDAGEKQSATNEQGYERSESPQTLPTVSGGVGVTPGGGTSDAAMGAVNGAEDG